MPRTYLPAEARCRQLVRLVASNPGLDVGQLAQLADLSYQAAKAYMRRLLREERVEAGLDDPALPRSRRRYYPLGTAAQRKAAA